MCPQQMPTLACQGSFCYSVQVTDEKRRHVEFLDIARAKARFLAEIARAERTADSDPGYRCTIKLVEDGSALMEFRLQASATRASIPQRLFEDMESDVAV